MQILRKTMSDIFLNLPGIGGESNSPRHKGEIDVFSFSFGGANGLQAAGQNADELTKYDGKALGDFNVIKRIDRSSSALLEAFMNGKTFDIAAVMMERQSGQSFGFDFKEVIISAISTFRQSNNEPGESISFNFKTYSVRKND